MNPALSNALIHFDRAERDALSLSAMEPPSFAMSYYVKRDHAANACTVHAPTGRVVMSFRDQDAAELAERSAAVLNRKLRARA